MNLTQALCHARAPGSVRPVGFAAAGRRHVLPTAQLGVRGEGHIIDVIHGVLPFLLIMLSLVALLWFFPVIALGLPSFMAS